MAVESEKSSTSAVTSTYSGIVTSSSRSSSLIPRLSLSPGSAYPKTTFVVSFASTFPFVTSTFLNPSPSTSAVTAANGTDTVCCSPFTVSVNVVLFV